MPASSLAKSTRKSIQHRSRESLRGFQNRRKIDPGTLSGHPVSPKSVPGASRERPGSVSGIPGAWRKRPESPQRRPGTPERAPRSARVHAEATKIDTKSCPGATNSSVITRSSFVHHRRSDFASNFSDFRACRTASEPSKVLRLPAKTKVWRFALQVELLARCYLENRRKSTPTSIRNRRKSPPGAARAPFSVGLGRSKRLGRATRSDPERGKLDRGRARSNGGRSRRPSRSSWAAKVARGPKTGKRG